MSNKKTNLEIEINKHRKSKEPVYKTMALSREDIEYILESNTENRNLNDRLVDHYAKIMSQAGRWVINGECIKISKTGKLLDGQHRLHGAHKSNCKPSLTVCFGLDDNAFKTLDTGRTRSPGDILHMAGYKNWNNLAAIMRYMLIYQADESWQSSSFIFSPQDILDGVKRWPEFENIIIPSRKLSFIFSSSIAGFFMYLARSIDEDMFWDFFQKLESGEKLKKSSSILQFRELMLKYRAQNLALDKRHLLANLIEAWNHYYYDEPANGQKWHTGKPFPVIAGVDRKKLFKKHGKKKKRLD